VLLTDEEKRMQGGGSGRLVRAALENIIRYAEVLGADRLCRVTKATVFCGAHNYLGVLASEDPDEVFSRLHLAKDEVIPFDRTHPGCYVQSDVAPCDPDGWSPFGQSETFFRKNERFLEHARQAGVIIAGTCAPYLTGWLPVKGEHFVTTESGVTVIGNALWGAMANADGIEAAFWSAICGRTPLWGNHLPENRAGTHAVRIAERPRSVFDWDVLGTAVGSRMPGGAVPVIIGDFHGASFHHLRQFCTSLAVTSSCEMCHIVGITPEARSSEDAFQGRPSVADAIIDRGDLDAAYRSICADGAGPVDLVSLGCPHYDIDQVKQVADLLDGRKVHPEVDLMVWTAYPVKAMADVNGYTRRIEAAGGRVCTSTCPTTIGRPLLSSRAAMVFDSLKQAASVRSSCEGTVYAGDVRRCIDAAVAGRWEENFRWRRA
jgi:predicted aconitase